MNKEYDFLVFIGRMRPFHNGHRRVILEALNRARYVIVLVGSSFKERTPKNPWLYDEVREMIHNTFNNPNIIVLPLQDKDDDNEWVDQVKTIVKGLTTSLQPSYYGLSKIGLVGHTKDDSSYYLKLFSEWGRVEIDNTSGINATDIREVLFKEERFIPFYLPTEVETYLVRWKFANEELFKQLQKDFIAKL